MCVRTCDTTYHTRSCTGYAVSALSIFEVCMPIVAIFRETCCIFNSLLVLSPCATPPCVQLALSLYTDHFHYGSSWSCAVELGYMLIYALCETARCTGSGHHHTGRSAVYKIAKIHPHPRAQIHHFFVLMLVSRCLHQEKSPIWLPKRAALNYISRSDTHNGIDLLDHLSRPAEPSV